MPSFSIPPNEPEQHPFAYAATNTMAVESTTRIAYLEGQLTIVAKEREAVNRSASYLLQMAYREHEVLSARVKELEVENLQLRIASSRAPNRDEEIEARQPMHQVSEDLVDFGVISPEQGVTNPMRFMGPVGLSESANLPAHEQPPILDLSFRGTKTAHDEIPTTYEDFVKSTTQKHEAQHPEVESAAALEARVSKALEDRP